MDSLRGTGQGQPGSERRTALPGNCSSSIETVLSHRVSSRFNATIAITNSQLWPPVLGSHKTGPSNNQPWKAVLTLHSWVTGSWKMLGKVPPLSVPWGGHSCSIYSQEAREMNADSQLAFSFSAFLFKTGPQAFHPLSVTSLEILSDTQIEVCLLSTPKASHHSSWERKVSEVQERVLQHRAMPLYVRPWKVETTEAGHATMIPCDCESHPPVTPALNTSQEPNICLSNWKSPTIGPTTAPFLHLDFTVAAV